MYASNKLQVQKVNLCAQNYFFRLFNPLIFPNQFVPFLDLKYKKAKEIKVSMSPQLGKG